MLPSMNFRLVLLSTVVAFAGLAAADAPGQVQASYLAPENAPVLPEAPRRYQPPEGFAGHTWGQTRATFDRLPEQAQTIRAAWTRGKERIPEFICTGFAMNGSFSSSCSITDILAAVQAARTGPEGAGFHVLSEYKIDSQGFRFTDSGVTLHPVLYQFCANWNSVKREEPADFDELNKFCGMRMLFETESLAQLRDLPDDHVTRYELVLAELISRYGKPAKFLMRGKVSIHTMDDTASERSGHDRKFSSWRWCPAKDRSMKTSCPSSIVLSIDPESGRGVVVFATPALWRYAWASQDMSGDDALFALMHGRKPRTVASR
jgi:hypothetical protein